MKNTRIRISLEETILGILPTRMTSLRRSDDSTPEKSATMGGARSPMTTKKAIAVPIKKPIMLISTLNLPAGPKVW